MSDQPSAPSSTDGSLGVSDLETFAEEIAAFVERKLSALPAPEKPVAPVINVAPAAATVEVSVPQQPTPVVNVETVAPNITVEATAPIVNVATPAPQVSIENHPASITVQPTPPAQVAIDMALVARAIGDQTFAMQSDAGSVQSKLDGLIAATNAMTSAIKDLAAAMTAPKTIVTDASGKPVGVRVN
jgi:hypothetical protein